MKKNTIKKLLLIYLALWITIFTNYFSIRVYADELSQVTQPPLVEKTDIQEVSKPSNADIKDVKEPPSVTPLPQISDPRNQLSGKGQATSNHEHEDVKQSKQSLGGNVGDTSIYTNNSSNTTILNTSGNNNTTIDTCCMVLSMGVDSKSNGFSSHNNDNLDSKSRNELDQNNSAQIVNSLQNATITGNNKSSFNVGNTSIDTGNANTTGSIISSVNSNIVGLSISEFNISDNHIGDYLLDFKSNCISGCNDKESTEIKNNDNGVDSSNNISSENEVVNSTSQNNNADIENELELTADSGNNSSNFNTNGDTSIKTGNANIAANVINLVNTNIAGNVILGVVNIFGNLIGDIILPDDICSANCNNENSQIEKSGNGSGTNNSSNVNSSSNKDTLQNNNTTIENNLTLETNSGYNNTGFNTDGNSSINSGNTSTDANVVNISNANLIDGTWWLVIVKKAGQWIGQILGSPNSNMGGSDDTKFIVDDKGDVIVTNSNNSNESDNSISKQSENSSEINQENNSNIANNINLKANTGNNNSNYNTNGDSDIITGDARIIVNIVNFVNNNIVGNGKLVVTLINVFGTWIGDFIGPGQNKESISNQIDSVENSGGLEGVPSISNYNTENSMVKSDEIPDLINIQNHGFIISSSVNVIKDTTIKPLATFDNKSDATGESTEFAQSKKIAGIQAVNRFTDHNKLAINLAWLIIILPLIIVIFVLKHLTDKAFTMNFKKINYE